MPSSSPTTSPGPPASRPPRPSVRVRPQTASEFSAVAAGAAASMPAVNPAEASFIEARGTPMAPGPGASRRRPRRSATLSARARQLTPQARRKRTDATSRCPRAAGGRRPTAARQSGAPSRGRSVYGARRRRRRAAGARAAPRRAAQRAAPSRPGDDRALGSQNGTDHRPGGPAATSRVADRVPRKCPARSRSPLGALPRAVPGLHGRGDSERRRRLSAPRFVDMLADGRASVAPRSRQATLSRAPDADT